MKDYLVNVRCIQSTGILVKALNKNDAILKVKGVLNKSINSENTHNKLFNDKPFFEYEAKKVNFKRSQMCKF